MISFFKCAGVDAGMRPKIRQSIKSAQLLASFIERVTVEESLMSGDNDKIFDALKRAVDPFFTLFISAKIVLVTYISDRFYALTQIGVRKIISMHRSEIL